MKPSYEYLLHHHGELEKELNSLMNWNAELMNDLTTQMQINKTLELELKRMRAQ